ncbi:flagellar protein FlaG [Duganella callida]|uniref:Flagellar protein FlaG n=1 Tax=Duganella callida TaxID=2561932 RepID=A0A4Y9SQT7_9BURK|nr:flagellar protein FlaG [Duganella callida]TFW27106.1 flagellar protein FlaG [Duganella callida]
MDTSSINRLELPPATAALVAAARATSTAKSIVAGKDDAATKVPSKTELKQSVDAINRFLEDNNSVRFSIDEDSGLSVIKVIDTETDKVLQQFPSEQSLEIGKRLTKQGLLIDSKV